MSTEEHISDSVETHVYKFGFDITNLSEKEYSVEQGDFLTKILKNIHLSDAQISTITALPDSIIDARKMKPGDKYFAYYNDTVIQYFVYMKGKLMYSAFDLRDSVYATMGMIPVDTIYRTTKVIIKTSLWSAVDSASLPIDVFNSLSDIYAWTVDFFGLQKNDEFRIYYSSLYADSVYIGLDKIWAAQYNNGSTQINAIYYDNGEIKGYWNQRGENLRKAFLKAPLQFSRISSKFTYARKHPVYKVVRPHTGVDYAAPAGTPVHSIGDGIVVEKGYKGGGGNTVKIRHNSEYTSAYLHLSKFAQGIKVGQRVAQGQVIGYVGSTGASTGAHLDFRVWKGGTPIDPLKMESPASIPIPENDKFCFDSIANCMIGIIESIN